jgi:pimeloyl-ACP methyl ester carboxylesterase
MLPPLLDAGFRVVRYDLRGFGRTEHDDVEVSNRADVVAVMDALGIERAALVGNSRGGHIAFDTAVEYPDRVVAIVGVGTSVGGFDHDPSPEEAAIFDEMAQLEEADPIDVERLADLSVRVWADGLGQPADRVDPAIREAVREMTALSYGPGKLNGTPIPLDPPVGARIADLRCPVLVVAGGLDETGVIAVARYLETNAPNARAVFIPDVAHMVGMERPGELAAMVVNFLAPYRPWR